ncbi:hypothetical protein SMD11_1882 [Streptomyces albireticuli]|uniref:Uncharacterized protein n=1 Tax=Streptomyces albireticuli TaxID=1940 RepID=A0A1Z2KZQ5_9ACTN|nr:hypothetical protein SMD11_1882 [Streptomyces albireticuli]
MSGFGMADFVVASPSPASFMPAPAAKT